MIVEIKSTWGANPETVNEEMRAFFRENGKFKEDVYSGVSYEFRFIGHIDMVPLEILNHDKVQIEFHKGLKSMVDEALSSKRGMEAFKAHHAGAINIHIPSSELLSINETTWLDDECTENLQVYLNDGWRIIACIPRPGQRRPDYVLGRIE